MKKCHILFFFIFSLFSVSQNIAVIITIPKINISGVFEYNPCNRTTNIPFITGDTFRYIADFIVDETRLPFDTSKLTEGSIIFTHYRYLPFFINNILPHIYVHFILITHNSDGFNPVAYFKELLENPYLEYWFSRDINSLWHPKLKCLPLGIVSRPNYMQSQRKKIFRKILNNKPIKDKLLYMNFMVKTCQKQRKPIFEIFKNKSFVTVAEPTKSLYDFLRDLASSYFVICPRGSNLDTFRTWETLLCGSYPIVQHSYLDELFTDLPVVLIDDWEEVTEDFLLNKLKEFSIKKFNMEKVYASFWIKLLEGYKKEVKKKYNSN